jgi:hypothetical protein
MNTLSWLIYAGDALGKIGVLFEVIAVLSAVGIGVVSGVSEIFASFDEAPKGYWKKPFRYLWVTAIFAVLATVTPSQTVIYMIAASEAGEEIASNPQAQEMASDLGRLIQQKLDEALSDAGRDGQ